MNCSLLDAKIVERGKTQEAIASYLGISPSTFYRKKKGESDFFRDEIQKIRKFLSLSPQEVDEIFFDDQLTNT